MRRTQATLTATLTAALCAGGCITLGPDYEEPVPPVEDDWMEYEDP